MMMETRRLATGTRLAEQSPIRGMPMSVVSMKGQEGGDRPVTGSGMDRSVETRRMPQRTKIALGVAGLLILILAFWFFAPRAGSQTVAADRLTISPVRTGTFEDFIPLRARVTPLLTVYLDAI